jgi:hypothetical protein
MRRALLVVLAAAGCSLPPEFLCSGDAQCVSHAAAGRCIPAARHCAFSDSRCASGLAFANYSGADSGRCVVDVDGGAGD